MTQAMIQGARARFRGVPKHGNPYNLTHFTDERKLDQWERAWIKADLILKAHALINQSNAPA